MQRPQKEPAGGLWGILNKATSNNNNDRQYTTIKQNTVDVGG